jgi:hypothetical protein
MHNKEKHNNTKISNKGINKGIKKGIRKGNNSYFLWFIEINIRRAKGDSADTILGSYEGIWCIIPWFITWF